MSPGANAGFFQLRNNDMLWYLKGKRFLILEQHDRDHDGAPLSSVLLSCPGVRKLPLP